MKPHQWPKPMQKKWRVPRDEAIVDSSGNICINPHDQTGRMFVHPDRVELT